MIATARRLALTLAEALEFRLSRLRPAGDRRGHAARAPDFLPDFRSLLLSNQADLAQLLFNVIPRLENGVSAVPEITEFAARALGAARVGLWRRAGPADEESLACVDFYDRAADRHSSDARMAPPRAAVDPQGDGFFVDDLASSDGSGALHIPIMSVDKPLGVLRLERDAPAPEWSAEERMHATLIALLVALAMAHEARRRAEHALQKNAQQMRALADSVPALIMYVDATETIQFHNQAYLEWFGHQRRSAVGRTVRQMFGEILYREVEPHLRATLAGKALSFRCLYKTPDGTERADLVHFVPHRGPEGQIDGFYALFVDISQQRRDEQALQEAFFRAEQAARARDEFFATVSHELRTPLHAIIGFNSVLLAGEYSVEERRRYLGYARNAGLALLAQVNDLLDMAKIESGKMELESIEFLPGAVVEAAMEVFREQARERGLHLFMELQCGASDWVKGDPNRLRQILLNLIGNAVKFTERGSITVRACRVGENLELSVADTGVGIAPAKLAAVFDRFAQTDPSISRRYGGTGLGLAICKSLTELMGGRVAVESAPGVGSVFRVVLPLPVCHPAPRAAPDAARDVSGKRVLVVEDQEMNQVLAAVLLESLGLAFRIVSGGAEALEALARERFDLVLMDLEMPVLDGLETTRRIRALPGAARQVPIIAMSAAAYRTDVERCKAAGMNDHLSKPVDRDMLSRKLADWLGAGAPSWQAAAGTAAGEAPAPFARLASSVGQAAVLRVVKAFYTALPSRLAPFRAPRPDPAAARLQAHNLVGMAGTLGLDNLADAARQIERRCQEGQPFDDLIPGLLAEGEAAARVIEPLLAAAGPLPAGAARAEGAR